MKKNLIPYRVTFKKAENIYCTNIARAESKQAVETRYTDKYGWCVVDECSPYQLMEAQRRRCPIVTIE